MDEKGIYGSEKPAEYRPRVVDEGIRVLLDLFGGVEVAGTKWCGKTWSALAFGESVIHVDDDRVKTLVAADPALALDGARPHVIDEWQEVPSIWDAVRRAIDASGSEKGSYLLTGSSTPEKDKVVHSGAGRIARLRMHTMSLWEQGASSGAVSLSGLFEGSFRSSSMRDRVPPLAQAVCRGGWPALVDAGFEAAAPTIDGYLDALFEVSVPKKGGSSHTARRLPHPSRAMWQRLRPSIRSRTTRSAMSGRTLPAIRFRSTSICSRISILSTSCSDGMPPFARGLACALSRSATSPTPRCPPSFSEWVPRGCSAMRRRSAFCSNRCACTTCVFMRRLCPMRSLIL